MVTLTKTVMTAALCLLSTTSWAQDTEGEVESQSETNEVPVATCDNPLVLVGQATNDIENYFLSEAALEVEQASAALGCSAMADPYTVSRIWQAYAMLDTLNGKGEHAPDLLLAAGRTMPDAWNYNYGEDAKKLFDAEQPSATGKLILKGKPRSLQVAIDGTLATSPYNLVEGLHLIQVGKFPDGNAEFASEFRITAGSDLVLLVKAQTVDMVALPDGTVAPRPKKGSLPLVIAGVAAGGASVGAFLIASNAHTQFMLEPDEERAKPSLDLNHGANIAGWVLGAAGVGLVTVAVIKGEW